MANVDKSCDICKRKAKHQVIVLGFELCKKHYDMKMRMEKEKKDNG